MDFDTIVFLLIKLAQLLFYNWSDPTPTTLPHLLVTPYHTPRLATHYTLPQLIYIFCNHPTHSTPS